ncbi:MAG: ribonuclease Z [Candidatus Hodarchaeota archaeon]
MELIILGSSAAIPVRERNLPSIALKYKNEIILFDCGEDLQRRIIDAGLKFNKSLKILISHFHGDHIIGLPGLLFRFGLIDRDKPLMIFGPRNLFLYLYLHRKLLGLKANYPISIIEIDHMNNKLIEFQGLENEAPIRELEINNNIIFDSKRYILKYCEVEHSILTFGYSFIEKPRSGKFNPEMARKLGIPESQLWKKMHEGEIIKFDGKNIDPFKEGIVGPKRPGRKITYSGDTAPSENLIKLGENSDILIHEATFSTELLDLAKEKKHSTSVDAANAAIKMKAKQLILTHISSRYQGDSNRLLKEAKEKFSNTILAEDLLKIEL